MCFSNCTFLKVNKTSFLLVDVSKFRPRTQRQTFQSIWHDINRTLCSTVLWKRRYLKNRTLNKRIIFSVHSIKDWYYFKNLERKLRRFKSRLELFEHRKQYTNNPMRSEHVLNPINITITKMSNIS